MTARAVILQADARHLPLPDASVDLVVTSPPYFALRSYTDAGIHYQGQIGSETTPTEYLDALWACTRDWIRVLKPEGSLFVNLGDKYAQNEERSRNGNGNRQKVENVRTSVLGPTISLGRKDNGSVRTKSLLGIPWRYAIGCIDQLGLILRAEIIWAKPNGLPESVTDRVRRSHENWFHFVKQPRYYAAVDEIREGYEGKPQRRGGTDHQVGEYAGRNKQTLHKQWDEPIAGTNPLGKLPGSVWSIPSEPLQVPAHLGVDHFAAFPTEWPRRLILGWSPPGICTACGHGRRPVVDSQFEPLRTPQANNRRRMTLGDNGLRGETNHYSGPVKLPGQNLGTISGYACACPQSDAPTRPSVVLDPFGGTGTVALVAKTLGRVGVSVDLSSDYSRLAKWRTTDRGEFAKALRVDKPPVQVENQLSMFGDVS